MHDFKKLKEMGKSKRKENKRFFAKLRQHPPKNFDEIMKQLHDETFAETNCLDCANCCKTTGPLFTAQDIKRISKLFNLKESDFIARYLRIDEENDYVLQQLPCPFLNEDNTCFIYDVRPKACREFPHTDRKNFYQIANLTVKNVSICPAAYSIVEKMKALIN